MSNISIRKMRAFLAVVEEKNFTRAAQKQSISQPAMTIIVNQIEEQLQKQCFIRQGKSRTTALSLAGTATAQTFARIVANYDIEVERLTLDETEGREEKRLLVQPHLVAALQQDWLNAILGMLKTDRVIVEELPRDTIISEIYERRASLALVDGKVDQERADYVSVANYQLVLAVPSGLSAPQVVDGYVTAGAITAGSYILGGFAKEVQQGLRALARSDKIQLDRFDPVIGFSVLGHLMKIDPRAVILPSCHALYMEDTFDCDIYEIGPNKVQSLVGLVAPWGYMSQYKLELIRRHACFIDDTNA